MRQYLFKIGYDRGCVEADRAYSAALRMGGFEFNGYNVFADGTMFWPFEVTPVDDAQAPADFVTINGGRYNAVH